MKRRYILVVTEHTSMNGENTWSQRRLTYGSPKLRERAKTSYSNNGERMPPGMERSVSFSEFEFDLR